MRSPINRSRKGTRHEAIVKEYLERVDGRVVHRAVRTPFQNQDIFGADLVAKAHGLPTRWIQVTSGSGIGQKKLTFNSYPWSEWDRPEIFLWRPRGPRRGRAHYEWHIRMPNGTWEKQPKRFWVEGGRIVND